MLRCDLVMANDVSGPVAFRALERMGVERVFDPERVVMVADHFTPAKDARSAELQKRLKDWSDAHGVTFYGQGRGGIEHTLLCEEGWIVPGSVIAGGDSHTCTYGALGAFGSGLGSTDIAACLALGEFWQQVPATIRVEFTGAKRPFVTGKDLILAVLAEIGVGGGTNAVLEFVGEGAEALTVDERLAVANMAVEAGAETGLFPADDVTADYLAGRTERPWRSERSDPDADFARELEIDLSTPAAAGRAPTPARQRRAARRRRRHPDRPGLHRQLRQRHDDRPASGRRASPRPASSPGLPRDRRPGDAVGLPPGARRGLLDVFVEAGAMVSTPTCGACFGGHMGILGPGERAVATTNRNFRGRMGSGEAEVFLANAYVAAAAAVAGEIVDPGAVAA